VSDSQWPILFDLVDADDEVVFAGEVAGLDWASIEVDPGAYTVEWSGGGVAWYVDVDADVGPTVARVGQPAP